MTSGTRDRGAVVTEVRKSKEETTGPCPTGLKTGSGLVSPGRRRGPVSSPEGGPGLLPLFDECSLEEEGG